MKDLLRASWRAFCLALILTAMCGVSHASSQLPDGLILETSTINLGRLVVGSSTVVNELILNPTSSDIRIASASLDSSTFQISGASFPLVIGAGQVVSIAISFSATVTGKFSGSLVLSLNGTDPYATIPMYATVVAPGLLTANPPSINFAPRGGSQQVVETLTNSGGSVVTVAALTISGAGFVLSRPYLPMNLRPNQSASFNVSIPPPGTGNASGSIDVKLMVAQWLGGSRGDYDHALTSKTDLLIPVSQTTAAVGQLTPAPASVNFGSIQVGNTQTQLATLTNSGNGNLNITQATATGAGFSLSGLPLPMSLAPGESVTFSAAFTPELAGSAQGKIAIASNASNSTVNLALSGSGTAVGQLALSPASLNFGTVPIGKTSSLPAKLTASGSSVTVSSASVSTPEFSLAGVQLPFTIPAGQTASFTVTFAPQSSGATSANVVFGSNATPSNSVESLSGAGSAPPSHSVGLSWSAGGSNVSGYNIYRGSQSGGPYTKINSSPSPATAYGDGAVASGQTYFYVTTALDSAGAESSHSNEVQAIIPAP